MSLELNGTASWSKAKEELSVGYSLIQVRSLVHLDQYSQDQAEKGFSFARYP